MLVHNQENLTELNSEQLSLDEALRRLGGECPILTSLDLRFNDIDDDGAEKIAKALETNNTLTLLDLRFNKISDKGAEKIAESLQTNNTLTSLDLCDKEIGDADLVALTEMLTDRSETNTDPILFTLRYNNIGDKNKPNISDYLNRNLQLAKHETALTQLLNQDITVDISEKLECFLEESRQFYQTHGLLETHLLTVSHFVVQGLNAFKDSNDEKLDAIINTLISLQGAHSIVKEALALFVRKFAQYGMIDNALPLFVQCCIDNEPAAEALSAALLRAEEVENPFLGATACFSSNSTTFFGKHIVPDGFAANVFLRLGRPERKAMGMISKPWNTLSKKFIQARKEMLQLILMLRKNTLLSDREAEYDFCKLLSGLKAYDGRISVGPPPSLSELIGVNNPKIIDFDKLRTLALQLNKALHDNNLADAEFTNLLKVITNHTKSGFNAILERMFAIIAKVKEQITLNNELLQLDNNTQIISYEELVLNYNARFLRQEASNERSNTNTSKTTESITSINSEEVKQTYLARVDDFVSPYEQKFTELVERAINAERMVQTQNAPQQAPGPEGFFATSTNQPAIGEQHTKHTNSAETNKVQAPEPTSLTKSNG